MKCAARNATGLHPSKSQLCVEIRDGHPQGPVVHVLKCEGCRAEIGNARHLIATFLRDGLGTCLEKADVHDLDAGLRAGRSCGAPGGGKPGWLAGADAREDECEELQDDLEETLR